MIPLWRNLSLILAVMMLVSCLAAAQQNVSRRHDIFSGAADVGQTQQGSTVYDPATGNYLVTGGGADMWGISDAFHFTWVKVSGDATLTADVHFPSSNNIPLEKAVLIFRQSLDPASPYADIAIHADGHITLQYRSAHGGKTDDVVAPEHGSTRLRIERKDNLFTASTGSGDGKLTSFSSTTVIMDGSVYVGIGVCSHNANGLAAVTFSNVTIQEHSGPMTMKRQ
jgi:hypothetical protein